MALCRSYLWHDVRTDLVFHGFYWITKCFIHPHGRHILLQWKVAGEQLSPDCFITFPELLYNGPTWPGFIAIPFNLKFKVIAVWIKNLNKIINLPLVHETPPVGQLTWLGILKPIFIFPHVKGKCFIGHNRHINPCMVFWSVGPVYNIMIDVSSRAPGGADKQPDRQADRARMKPTDPCVVLQIFTCIWVCPRASTVIGMTFCGLSTYQEVLGSLYFPVSSSDVTHKVC